ncbi:MAG: AarF/UbiB family protein [Oligoflexales bacterium]
MEIFKEMVKVPFFCVRASNRHVWTSILDKKWTRLFKTRVVGDMTIQCMNELGPIYGKISQIGINSLPPQCDKLIKKTGLDRIYDDWPPLDFPEIQKILDKEFPGWKQSIRIEPKPIGVASMAQVHVITDLNGKRWAMKFVKPKAKKRIQETLKALNEVISLSKVAGNTPIVQKFFKEWEDFSSSLRKEVRLDLEKKNIKKIQNKLKKQKSQIIKIPEVCESLCTPDILTIEYFEGIPFKELLQKKQHLSDRVKDKLAQNVLKEFLVQIFEWGLFHGDPHAGNLILLEDGSIGLFDWGLTGEFSDKDRRYISSVLKSILTLDFSMLVDALIDIAKEENVEVGREQVEYELRKVLALTKKAREQGKKVKLHTLINSCFKAADKLGIPIPRGLFIMAKTLLTIEGLATGISPKASFTRAATPFLLKAANPSIKDFWKMTKNLPKLYKRMKPMPVQEEAST